MGWALGSDELASTLLVCGLGSKVGCREFIGGDLYTFLEIWLVAFRVGSLGCQIQEVSRWGPGFLNLEKQT